MAICPICPVIFLFIKLSVSQSSTGRAELMPSGYFCDWDAKVGEILRCQAVQTLVNCRAQLEGDTLRNIQPMQLIVEDLSQTPVELPCAGDDSGGGI